MKICFIVPFAVRLFYPHAEGAPFFGGAEVQQYQLAHALAHDRRFEVSCIMGTLKGASLRGDMHQNIVLYHALHIGKRIPVLHAIIDFFNIYRALRRIRPDVVVVRGGGVLAGKAAFITKTLLGKQFIFSSMHDRESSGAYWESISWYRTTLFRHAVRAAAIVICQHEGQKKGFKTLFNRDAVVMPSMYMIPPESDIMPYEAREYVLWVGRLEVWKQPEIFIDLARHYPRERFVLVNSSDTKEIRKYAHDVPGLSIVGPVAFAAMDEYFKKAKVFVNTSRSEGFPNTFVQAAKNGVPIISLAVNPDSILEHYSMGNFAHGDTQRLTDDCALFLHNKKTWQEASENGYRYARERHDIQTVAEQYKTLFISLCA